jgi:hypothetical protein
MQKQSLAGRMETMCCLEKEVGAWRRQRNQKAKIMQWHFTTEDARIKRKKLYPTDLVVQPTPG